MLRNRIKTFLNENGTIVTHDGWQVHLYGNNENNNNYWKDNLHGLSKYVHNPANIIKQDHRSFVAAFEYDSTKYVIKKFTLQNTWFWFRWTSIFFESLGEIAYRNSIMMQEEGMLTAEPVMLWQKTSKFSVYHSWMLYKYLDGKPMNSSDSSEIVEFVKKMHSKGWLHRDPHPSNFLRTSKGVATIDPIRVKKSTNRYLRACDLLHMIRDMPSAYDVYGGDEIKYWLKLARYFHNHLRLYRAIKHKLRTIVGYKPHKISLGNITNSGSALKEGVRKND